VSERESECWRKGVGAGGECEGVGYMPLLHHPTGDGEKSD
jgi:hypothetical protein